MKKYLLFGLISGAVVSALYPSYYTFIACAQFIGLSDNIIRILAFILYAVLASLIWKRLDAEFSMKALLFLSIGCITSMFAMIGIHCLYFSLWRKSWSWDGAGVFLNIWRSISRRGIIIELFDFRDILGTVEYISQLIMQVVPFIVMCKLNKKYKY